MPSAQDTPPLSLEHQSEATLPQGKPTTETDSVDSYAMAMQEGMSVALCVCVCIAKISAGWTLAIFCAFL